MRCEANAQIKTHYPNAGLKVIYQDYQRGIFSSSVRFVVQPDGTAPDNLLQPGDEIAFVETIDHGPFPPAQVKKLNLIPSAASVHSELQNTPTVKDLFALTQGKSPISADSRVGYSGDTASVISVLPINYQKNTSKLEFAGGTINLDIAKDLQKINFDTDIGSVAFSSPNQWGQQEKVTISGINMKSDSHLGQSQLYVGEGNLSTDNINVNIDGKDAAQVAGMKVHSNFNEQQQNLKGQLDYSIDSLKIKGEDFGSGKLTLKLDKIDVQALKQFQYNYNQQAMQLMKLSDNSTRKITRSSPLRCYVQSADPA